MFRIFKIHTLRNFVFNNEQNAACFLPYKCHWDDHTLITKDNEFLQVIKVDGFSFETADDEDLDIKKNIRNSLLKNIASGNIILYFHTFRKRKAKQLHAKKNIDPTAIKPVWDFLFSLSDACNKKHLNKDSFFNELYISVLYKPDKTGAAMVQYFLKKISQKSDQSNWKSDMHDMYVNLEEISSRITNTLKSYGTKLLGIKKVNEHYCCEILEFLGTIVNCGKSMPFIVPRSHIDKYITTNRLFFGSKSIELTTTHGSRYAAMLGISEYCNSTSSGMFDGFLQMPFEFIITQGFITTNKVVIVNKMQLQQNRMIQVEDKAVSQITEISQALDMATSGDIGFGEHFLSILCIDDNLKTLENNISLAAVELSNKGIKPARESLNLEPAYWGQLPGNMQYITRLSTINTLNMASFASMHNYPIGKIVGNHWGEYTTILDTTSGTPFYFSFHVKDVGHTLIIGPTGAGKTVLMNFLCAQAQKFMPRMFFFDKDRGAEIFIRAIHGKYTMLNPSAKCNFNPLQLSDTGENRTFLLEWLKTLITSGSNKSVSDQDIKVLNRALNGNYKLEQKDRKLSNIAPFLGIDGPDTLASRLSMWHSNGAYAKIFDNDKDEIDLTIAKSFGFEMGELLKDPISLPPVLLYIFHRINISLDGSPTMIVLDEAWALIDNQIFAPKIKDWLKVLRKLNTFVIFATQSVEDAANSTISDTLVQQTATQIFLPNLRATEIYRNVFMLSQREYTLIKTTDPSSRYFLLKQGTNAIIAKVNLNDMGGMIDVLGSRIETILLLDQIRKQYGDDPKEWLPRFYEEVQNL